MKKETILIPITIVIGAVIIGLFIKAGIENKQIIQTSQEKQEYIGKRKLDCYEILQKERYRVEEAIVSVDYLAPSSNPFEGKDFNDVCRVKYFYMFEDGKTYTEYANY